LWNARQFLHLFAEELEHARRGEQPLAFLIADLDLLRNINNTYGHLAGDTVLAGIGQTIRQTIRTQDIAARFGGEEFAIILPGIGRAEACAIAEQLRRTVESTQFAAKSSPTPISATLSIGIACFPQDATSGTNLIHEADIAVYQAKLQGRNRVVSITDVPQCVKLSAQPVRLDTRIAEEISVPFGARSELMHNVMRSQAEIEESLIKQTPTQTVLQPDSGSSPTQNEVVESEEQPPQRFLWVFIAIVILAGFAAAIFGVVLQPRLDLVAIGLFTGLALLTEFWHVDLYDKGSISVSVAIFFAIGLISGFP